MRFWALAALAMISACLIAESALAQDRTRAKRNEGQCQPGVSQTESGPCWAFAPLAADGTATLPFTFDFGGQSFDTIGVSNRGYVWFGNSGDPNLTAASDLASLTTAVIVPFLSSGFTTPFGFAFTEKGGPSVPDPSIDPPQVVTSLFIGESAFRVSWGDEFNNENSWGLTIAKLEGGAGFVVEVNYQRILFGAGPNDTVIAGFTNGAGVNADFLALFNPATDIDLFNCSIASETDPCGANTAGPDSYVGDGFDEAIPGEFGALTLRERFLTSHDTSESTIGVIVDGRALFRFGQSVIPEPATWGLMILGFGLLGRATRRRSPA